MTKFMLLLLIAAIVIVVSMFLVVHLQPDYKPVNPFTGFIPGEKLSLAHCSRIIGAPDNLEVYNCFVNGYWIYIQADNTIITYVSYSVPKHKVSVGDLVSWYGANVPKHFNYPDEGGLFAWVRNVSLS